MPIKSIQNISKQSQGFTLIELIMIIVLLAIFGTMGADFISKAFKGFQASNSRMEIFEEGKAAMTRMEREINNAIPNAVIVTTSASGNQELRIGVIDDNIMVSDNVTGRYIESPPTNKITDDTGGLGAGVIVSINNTKWDTFADPVTSNRRLYKVITQTDKEMTLDRTIPPDSLSPNDRFYAVDKAIRYYYDSASSELRRSEIDVNATNTPVDDTAFAAVNGYPLATNVSNLDFHYTPGAPARNSVVTISFKITKNNESILFNKDVHVRNTP